MHDAAYLKDHPDAAPVGTDGKPCPPPDGWQGVCPTHPGYREARMEAFRKALSDFEIDGIWLDYHHAHASWEQAVPNLPDTCFCARCLARFERGDGHRPARPADAGAGPDAARAAQGRVGRVALRRLHRLGPRVPRDPRRGPPRRAAGDVPLPLVARTTSAARCATSWRST